MFVSSSLGGAIADSRATPLVILYTSWKGWETAKKLKRQATILHSRQGDVIANMVARLEGPTVAFHHTFVKIQTPGLLLVGQPR